MSYEYYHPNDDYITDPAYAEMEGNYYHIDRSKKKKTEKKKEPEQQEAEDKFFSYDVLYEEVIGFDKTGLTEEQIKSKIEKKQKEVRLLLWFFSIILVLCIAAVIYGTVARTAFGYAIGFTAILFGYHFIVPTFNLARVLHASKHMKH